VNDIQFFVTLAAVLVLAALACRSIKTRKWFAASAALVGLCAGLIQLMVMSGIGALVFMLVAGLLATVIVNTRRHHIKI